MRLQRAPHYPLTGVQKLLALNEFCRKIKSLLQAWPVQLRHEEGMEMEIHFISCEPHWHNLNALHFAMTVLLSCYIHIRHDVCICLTRFVAPQNGSWLHSVPVVLQHSASAGIRPLPRSVSRELECCCTTEAVKYQHPCSARLLVITQDAWRM